MSRRAVQDFEESFPVDALFASVLGQMEDEAGQDSGSVMGSSTAGSQDDALLAAGLDRQKALPSLRRLENYHALRAEYASQDFVGQDLGLDVAVLTRLSERCHAADKPFMPMDGVQESSLGVALWRYVESLNPLPVKELVQALKFPPPRILALIQPALVLGMTPITVLLYVACEEREEYGHGSPTMEIQQLFYFYFRFGVSHAQLDVLEKLGLPMIARGSRWRVDRAASNDSLIACIWIFLQGGYDLISEMVRDNYTGEYCFIL
jgi:hypothetical protein